MNSAICTKVKNEGISEKKIFMNHHDLAQKIFDNLKSPLKDNVISFLDEHQHNVKQELGQKNCFKNQPKKVWEIHPHFQCPVMGICLTFEENKKVLKKIIQTKGLDHYSLHRIIMGYINKENQVSIKIEHFLNKKYKKQLSYLINLDEDAFLLKWQEVFGNKPIDEMLYVAAIRPDLSQATIERIYGDIHMAGHTGISDVITLNDRCGFLEDSNKRMLRLLKQERKGRAFLEDQIVSLKQCIKNKDKIQKKESVPLKTSPECDLNEKVKYENQILLAQISKIQNENKDQSKYIKKIERENRQLQADFFDLQSNHQLLMDEINSLIAQLSFFMKFNENCDENCPKYHICAKRVLIVGGITKMKHLYKDLVECSGGEFEYHDGYVKNGTQNLENQVKRADLILCPVNCNSHTACKKVKGFCNKFDKPLKILTNASLSSISNALVSDSNSINSL